MPEKQSSDGFFIQTLIFSEFWKNILRPVINYSLYDFVRGWNSVVFFAGTFDSQIDCSDGRTNADR